MLRHNLQNVLKSLVLFTRRPVKSRWRRRPLINWPERRKKRHQTSVYFPEISNEFTSLDLKRLFKWNHVRHCEWKSDIFLKRAKSEFLADSHWKQTLDLKLLLHWNKTIKHFRKMWRSKKVKHHRWDAASKYKTGSKLHLNTCTLLLSTHWRESEPADRTQRAARCTALEVLFRFTQYTKSIYAAASGRIPRWSLWFKA